MRMRWERNCSWLEIFHALHAFCLPGSGDHEQEGNSRPIQTWDNTDGTHSLTNGKNNQDETHPA